MTTLELRGRITENGELEIRPPPGLPTGEVTARIEVPDVEAWKRQPWTDAELRELIQPMTRQAFIAWLEFIEGARGKSGQAQCLANRCPVQPTSSGRWASCGNFDTKNVEDFLPILGASSIIRPY